MLYKVLYVQIRFVKLSLHMQTLNAQMEARIASKATRADGARFNVGVF